MLGPEQIEEAAKEEAKAERERLAAVATLFAESQRAADDRRLDRARSLVQSDHYHQQRK